MFYSLNFSAYIIFFVTSLIETIFKVYISNELNFSDVYLSVNYIGSLESLYETLWGSFTLHATQSSLHVNEPQKNQIHSLLGVSTLAGRVIMKSQFQLYTKRFWYK